MDWQFVNTKRARLKRVLVRVLVGIAVVWLMCCGVLYHIMRQPPETFGHFMAKLPGPVPFLVFPFETLWMRARAGSLHVGDSAPDFVLAKLDKSDRVRLSALTATGQPVVLIFGSYT
jgi:hypothetical protein